MNPDPTRLPLRRWSWRRHQITLALDAPHGPRVECTCGWYETYGRGSGETRRHAFGTAARHLREARAEWRRRNGFAFANRADTESQWP